MKNILIVLMVAFPLVLNAQYTNYWSGKLNFGLEVTVEFNVTFGNDNHPGVITLDIPEQSVWETKCELIKWDTDSFNISIPGGAVFYGIKNDSVIIGNWIQRGVPIPLALKQSSKGIDPVRPQNPSAEHDYIEERLVITNQKDHVQLYGTLTIPKEYKMKACAVLISGSGQQDMDESMMGHKPFWVIADYLTRNGFAVIRFDDRGSYRSTGNYSTSSFMDFANDVNAVVDLAKERTGLSDDKIGLIGHSEGSIVAQVVLKDRPLGFYISLAGPAAPVQQIMYLQNRDMFMMRKVTESEFDGKVAPFLNKALNIIGDLSIDSASAAANIIKLYKKEEKKFSAEARALCASMSDERVAMLLVRPYRIFISYVPEANISNLKVPFFAINGNNDRQVNCKLNLDIFRKYIGNNPLNEVREVENKNHLFQTSNTGNISEYGKLEETFSPDVLEMMKTWLNKVYP